MVPFQSSDGPVGIDFGSRGVRMAQLRRRRKGLQVVGLARIDLDPAAAPETLPHDFVEAVRMNFAAGGFTGRRCVVSLHRSDVQVQSIRLPKMSDSELADAAVWEAAQRFGLDRKMIRVDYARLGEVQQGNEIREEVLLIAAPLERIHARIEPLLEAGLRPMAIDTSFMALGRFLSLNCRREADQSRIRAVVELGASGSTLMILRGDQMAFCKTMALGGDHLDRAVAEYLQIDAAAARDLRSRPLGETGEIEGSGSAGSAVGTGSAGGTVGSDEVANRMIFEATRPLFGQLAKELGLCLRYYSVTYRGPVPECVYLTGGDGLDPRLAPVIEQMCKVRTMSADSVFDLETQIHARGLGAGRPVGPSACWNVAAGLSLRGFGASRSDRRGDEIAGISGVASGVPGAASASGVPGVPGVPGVAGAGREAA